MHAATPRHILRAMLLLSIFAMLMFRRYAHDADAIMFICYLRIVAEIFFFLPFFGALP